MGDLVVLHLSDLHFGIKNPCTTREKHIHIGQEEAVNTLINTLLKIKENEPEWAPDVVAITGDIGWSGEKADYEKYKENLCEPFEKILGIEEKYIITCPGNHDIMWDRVEGKARYMPGWDHLDPDIAELDMNQMKKQSSNFQNYVDALCGEEDICRRVTYPEWPWAHFLILNSAWDCRPQTSSATDEGRLRVGLSILQELMSGCKEGDCIITLYHHPATEVLDVREVKNSRGQTVLSHIDVKWLHTTELHGRTPAEPTFYSYVQGKSTYILNGHIHEERQPRKTGKAVEFIEGTLYSNDTYRCHCRLIKIKQDDVTSYKDMRWTLGGAAEFWEVTEETKLDMDSKFEKAQKKAMMEKQRNEDMAEKMQGVQKRISELDKYSEEEKENIIKALNLLNILAKDMIVDNKLKDDKKNDLNEKKALENENRYSLRKGEKE